jgi:DNA-binding SARP family transcriptional activator
VARVAVEYRILGPLEASVDGNPMSLGGRRQRAVLAVLLLEAGRVVSTARLIEEVWPEGPPETADNLVQGYVSQLRKQLGRDAIETRVPGYVLRVDPEAVDLQKFERLATDGTTMLADGEAVEAASRLGAALSLWRGAALADLVTDGVLAASAARLDDLRLVALEQRIEADLASGRTTDVIGELEALVAEEPFRERPWALLMLALYRSGRPADALAAYRTARSTLVDQLGIEPSPTLQQLERRILQHDQTLAAPSAATAPPEFEPHRCVVAWALTPDAAGALAELAEPLAHGAGSELVLVTTVAEAGELAAAGEVLRARKELVVANGGQARAAAFTSLTPGADVARLVVDLDVDLVLVEASDDLLEDDRLLTLLAEAPCDVAVAVGRGMRAGPVLVPFTGSEHDWAAVELGAWIASSRATPLQLAGATTGISGRDASRLLANASLAIQRAVGVDAAPLLVDPDSEELLLAAEAAGIVVVGLTDHWRRDGLGSTRTALARSAVRPTLVVRRGLRPGGLAPNGAQTQFTWTIAHAVG